MNAELAEMLPAITTWSEEDREALVEAAREIEAVRSGIYVMTPDEEAAVDEGLAEAERGEFANVRR